MATIILAILYVIGMFPTYKFLDKKTTQSKFNKVWFSIFWPAVLVFYLLNSIIK